MSKKFSTYDLGLATTLITLKYKLVELDKVNPKKVRFVFKEEKNTEKTMLDHWDDKISVPALTFFNNLKMLKNRLYSNKE